jgi:hypothetical protein
MILFSKAQGIHICEPSQVLFKRGRFRDFFMGRPISEVNPEVKRLESGVFCAFGA